MNQQLELFWSVDRNIWFWSFKICPWLTARVGFMRLSVWFELTCYGECDTFELTSFPPALCYCLHGLSGGTLETRRVRVMATHWLHTLNPVPCCQLANQMRTRGLLYSALVLPSNGTGKGQWECSPEDSTCLFLLLAHSPEGVESPIPRGNSLGGATYHGLAAKPLWFLQSTASLGRMNVPMINCILWLHLFHQLYSIGM